MIFTLRLLGLEVLCIELAQPVEPDGDYSRDLSGGTLASTPVGFTARWELPDGAARPEYDDD